MINHVVTQKHYVVFVFLK